MRKNFINIIVVVLVLMPLLLSAQVRYELPCREDVLSASRQVLIKQAGVREHGANRGPEVRQYLASVGLGEGYAYCAAGQYWCFKKAVENLHYLYSQIPIAKTAMANGIFNDGAKRGKKTGYKAVIHDLIIWKQTGSSAGHVERVYDVGAAGWVRTVGFNTSAGSGDQRDGQGVCIRNRNILHPLSRLLRIRGLVGFKKL